MKEEKPGEFPFTRGIHPTNQKLWTMRQYAGFGDAKSSNERYRYLLSQGTTGLSVAFDLPTQMGRDPDHPLSKGEVGRVGVSIASVEDMAILLDGLPLDKISISMTINATAAILLSYLLVVAEERGVPWSQIKGTTQNDILKEYIARGTYIYPVEHGMRLVTDVFSFCSEKVPNWNTISISGYHIREAGSTAIEEVAFTLANGKAYVKAALSKGLKIDDFAPRLSFFFNCHMNFFEEVAKFRAARRLWAKIMKDEFGAKDPKSLKLRFHTQTAGSSLTAQQPLNNVIRTTTEALAAVLGGTQSLHTNSYDEALGLPTEDSATLALRTQQIIAYETAVVDELDPLGGSYYVEKLTDDLERGARLLIDKVDGLGGMEKAISLGFPQECIEKSAYEFQRAVEQGDRIIVGVNKFTENDDLPSALTIKESFDEKLFNSFKNSRDQDRVKGALQAIKTTAGKDKVLIPFIIEAARARATTGEISEALRQVFGEYRQ